jgi:acyl-CoA reductase-like NAD-dependent aldehyde dehydrogenase
MTDTITSYNPATGEAIGSVAVSSPEEVAAAVTLARKAFGEWGSLTHKERRPYLQRFTKAVIANSDHIARVVSRETGKTIEDALLSEVSVSAAIADYAIRKAGKVLAPEKRSSFPFLIVKSWIEYEPRGVAGVITPWNYPFTLSFNSVVTALAAGCTVVLKPSDVTPFSGELIADLAAEAGFPSGVVQVVHGGAATGSALVKAVDVVSFTGCPQTGRYVAHDAADGLTPVIFELGGKDAMIVLDDADTKRAARGAVWGGLTNCGQVCMSVERVYVVDDVYDEFLSRLVAEFAPMNAGRGNANDIGPMTFPPQIEIVERHVEDAKGKGATVRFGGRRHPGDVDYYDPTLLLDVDHTMVVMTEETFGPVLAVMRVPNEEAAIELANDTSFGLHGSVWTKDNARGRRVASRMNTGTVAINDVLVNFGIVDLPFGGIKESGYGSRNGPEGLRAFCYPKSVTQRRFPLPRELWWFPRRGGRQLWKSFVRLSGRR